MFFFFFFDDETNKKKTLDEHVFERLKSLRDLGYYSGSDEKLKNEVARWFDDTMGTSKEEFLLMYSLWDVYVNRYQDEAENWTHRFDEIDLGRMVDYWTMRYHVYIVIQWLPEMPKYGVGEFDRLNYRLHDLVVGRKNFEQDEKGKIVYSNSDSYTRTIEKTGYVNYIWDSVWAILSFRDDGIDKTIEKEINGLLWWRNQVGPNIMITECLDHIKEARKAWREAKGIEETDMGKESKTPKDKPKEAIEELKNEEKNSTIVDETAWKSYYITFLRDLLKEANESDDDDKKTIRSFLLSFTAREKWLPDEIIKDIKDIKKGTNFDLAKFDEVVQKSNIVFIKNEIGTQLGPINGNVQSQQNTLPSPQQPKQLKDGRR